VKPETRSFVDPVEFRSDGARLTASGVAMRYGSRSKPIGGQFREEFRSGAFAKTIKEQDVKAHLEHYGPFLGRTGSGTLRLTDNRSELAFELDLPDTTAGRDAAALLERRDVAGASVAFRAITAETDWSVDEHGMALRSVGAAQLFAVDLTTSPAYDASVAELALRSLADKAGLELRSVIEAAEAGRLAEMIAPPESPVDEPEPEPTEPDGEVAEADSDEEPEGRESTFERIHIAHLYL